MRLPGRWPPGTRVLEVVCGEGGVLRAFLDRGCEGVGVERSGTRLERARELLAGALEQQNARLVNGDILDLEPEKDLGGRFDLVILKDAIEHTPEQPRLLVRLKDCLKPGGPSSSPSHSGRCPSAAINRSARTRS